MTQVHLERGQQVTQGRMTRVQQILYSQMQPMTTIPYKQRHLNHLRLIEALIGSRQEIIVAIQSQAQNGI